MKKWMAVIVSILYCVLGVAGCRDKPQDNGENFQIKTEMKKDGQLFTSGEVKFSNRLWQSPISERYEALDRGYAKGYFLESVADTQVFCFVGLPEGASATNVVPGIVLVHGGGGTSFYEWVNFWVNRGYAAIAMDTDGTMPVENSSMNTSNRRYSLKPHGPMNTDFSDSLRPVEEQWAYHALAAVIVANSFLRSFEGVDTGRIGITGISYGAFLTWQAVAYDDRFVFAAPVYGSPEQKLGNTVWGDIMRNKRGKTAELWDDIRILANNITPFFYLNSNVDSFFSVLSTSESDRLTLNSGMLLKFGFLHGHDLGGLQVPEVYAFADQVCRGESGLIRVIKQPTAESQRMQVRVPKGHAVKEVTGFYTTAKILNEKSVWHPVEGEIKDSVWAVVSIPENARYYYIQVKDDRDLAVSSRAISRVAQ